MRLEATAFLDASVLYPALLRNILMRLALHGLFQARWSARVHDEWMNALLRNRPDLDRTRLQQTRRLMDAHCQDALVEGFEHRIPALTLPDADDRHVLAAAIHSGATVLVTANLRDFPGPLLTPFAIEACHPDPFVADLVEAAPDKALSAFRQLRAAFKHPPRSVNDILAAMVNQGLVASSARIAALAQGF